MEKVILDRAALGKLLGTPGSRVAVCDESGNLRGHFIPVGQLRYEEPPVSEEELDQRSRQGGGRTLDEILKDLERRA